MYQRSPASGVGVEIRPATMTPEQACDDEADLEDMVCAEAARDLWVLKDGDTRTVFTVHGDTLVELHSSDVPEKQLLAAARALRPIGLWELAAPAYERQ
ncbi:hypothetical protein ACNF49_02265 [Actinomadura sp. ATCC 39365]